MRVCYFIQWASLSYLEIIHYIILMHYSRYISVFWSNSTIDGGSIFISKSYYNITIIVDKLFFRKTTSLRETLWGCRKSRWDSVIHRKSINTSNRIQAKTSQKQVNIFSAKYQDTLSIIRLKGKWKLRVMIMDVEKSCGNEHTTVTTPALCWLKVNFKY